MDADVKKYYFIARETIPGKWHKVLASLWGLFLKSLIAHYTQMAYTDIVSRETDPRMFLLVAKGDVRKAAEQLANYWMNRHYFFQDRWLLPMTQVSCPDVRACWFCICCPHKKKMDQSLPQPSNVSIFLLN